MATQKMLDNYAATSILSGSVKVPRGEVSEVGLHGRDIQRVSRGSH